MLRHWCYLLKTEPAGVTDDLHKCAMRTFFSTTVLFGLHLKRPIHSFKHVAKTACWVPTLPDYSSIKLISVTCTVSCHVGIDLNMAWQAKCASVRLLLSHMYVFCFLQLTADHGVRAQKGSAAAGKSLHEGRIKHSS